MKLHVLIDTYNKRQGGYDVTTPFETQYLWNYGRQEDEIWTGTPPYIGGGSQRVKFGIGPLGNPQNPKIGSIEKRVSECAVFPLLSSQCDNSFSHQGVTFEQCDNS